MAAIRGPATSGRTARRSAWKRCRRAAAVPCRRSGTPSTAGGEPRNACSRRSAPRPIHRCPRRSRAGTGIPGVPTRRSGSSTDEFTRAHPRCTSRRPSAREITGNERLLALGDSFSSGQGAGSYDPGTNGGGNTCFRSPRAWPQELATRLDLVALPSLACSGAVIHDVTTGRDGGESERRSGQLGRIAGTRASSRSASVATTSASPTSQGRVCSGIASRSTTGRRAIAWKREIADVAAAAPRPLPRHPGRRPARPRGRARLSAALPEPRGLALGGRLPDAPADLGRRGRVPQRAHAGPQRGDRRRGQGRRRGFRGRDGGLQRSRAPVLRRDVPRDLPPTAPGPPQPGTGVVPPERGGSREARRRGGEAPERARDAYP